MNKKMNVYKQNRMFYKRGFENAIKLAKAEFMKREFKCFVDQNNAECITLFDVINILNTIKT